MFESNPQFAIAPSEAPFEAPIFSKFKQPEGLGPLLRFADIVDGVWTGSVLIMLPLGSRPPTLELSTGRVTSPVLIDAFGRQEFYRYDLAVSLREEGQLVGYKVGVWEYSFNLPAITENSRIAFWTCNGFDCDQKEPEKYGGGSPMWRDLLRNHSSAPYHVQIGGGDQLYMDGQVNIFDLPLLRGYLESADVAARDEMPWTVDYERQVSACYFRAYTSHFQLEAFAEALATIPYTFVCDDHDIFDGFGSYPEKQQLSPIIQNIGRIAFRFYLLFQHHTNFTQAFKDGLFPEKKGYNWLKKTGPSTLTLALDVRSRRTDHQIMPEDTWKSVWTALEDRVLSEKPKIKHLILVATVPVLYPRMDIADHLFEGVNTIQTIARNLFRPFIKCLLPEREEKVFLGGLGHGSVARQLLGNFGQPELRDDLMDEWTHVFHMTERNNMVSYLQKFAERHGVRVTFASGDVHICGMGRFRSEGIETADVSGKDVGSDPRAMYQIISSAIGNGPGPDAVIAFLHTNPRVLSTSVTKLDNTVEEMFELFQTDVNGEEKSHKRLMARRNWCSIDYNASDDSLDTKIHVENIDFNAASVAYGVQIPKLA
ncbi:hypothetical protein BCR33DRAFT_714698 [Rhizoclosmatium globosum]|uniref:PhoD-like phosphatase domain-containing protein n=1 Tax=Rhizoclosmatium globosum TaxID=329046 RepID=A0A1Y2CMU2_9FUNG|nr:hypothetical protein BCR33DRAFT_714698 [Rhizoclosmatium globosum]|eukprot:ORY48323.1 hypothetical protein BCR33DRAFT_714698 [Rhizoclosmatium globosum]